jgi:DNA-binding response OmpR family regulator
MESSLAGHHILIVEDEPLIALDIKQALEEQGAKVVVVRTLADALRAIQNPHLSGAILDHALSDGDTTEICARLKERSLPFVTFSGYDRIEGPCSEGVHITKPARISTLVATVEALLGPHAAPAA